jgi:hypothetical protein
MKHNQSTLMASILFEWIHEYVISFRIFVNPIGAVILLDIMRDIQEILVEILVILHFCSQLYLLELYREILQ